MHLSSPMSGLYCIFPPYFLKTWLSDIVQHADNFFRPAAYLVLLLSVSSDLFKDSLNTTLRYSKFSANSSLKIILLVQKVLFYVLYTVIFNIFHTF